MYGVNMDVFRNYEWFGVKPVKLQFIFVPFGLDSNTVSCLVFS